MDRESEVRDYFNLQHSTRLMDIRIPIEEFIVTLFRHLTRATSVHRAYIPITFICMKCHDSILGDISASLHLSSLHFLHACVNNGRYHAGMVSFSGLTLKLNFVKLHP
jgi:hypothetical protein